MITTSGEVSVDIFSTQVSDDGITWVGLDNALLSVSSIEGSVSTESTKRKASNGRTVTFESSAVFEPIETTFRIFYNVKPDNVYRTLREIWRSAKTNSEKPKVYVRVAPGGAAPGNEWIGTSSDGTNYAAATMISFLIASESDANNNGEVQSGFSIRYDDYYTEDIS